MVIPKDFFLLRTPFLPLNFLDQFNELTHTELKDRLKVIFSLPHFQEAIYIASPELYQQFQKWNQGHLVQAREVDKLVSSLFKYLLRMSARCTPYGLFAGCAVGEFDQSTRIILAHPDQHKKHCRLDMNIVAELAGMICQLPQVQHQLDFYPNNSLYKIENKYRYSEFTIANKFRSYHLTEVSGSQYLEKIIKAASNGAGLSVLVESIATHGISEDEAAGFVMELLENQILVSELEPTVTGVEFFIKLIEKLHTLENTAGITEKLTRIHQLLQDQATGIDKYLQTHALVKQFLPDANNKDLIQSDLFLATVQNTISATVITDIQQQIDKLWNLVRQNYNTDLVKFRNKFNERYEEQEIPLLIALDAEAGIGYAGYSESHTAHAPLIDDISTGNAARPASISWSKVNEFQLRKLHACLSANTVEMVLTDNDLDELKETTPSSVPDSLYLMGNLLGKSASAIDSGDYRFELNSFGGPSAANLLGRFCHGHDVLTAKVKECLQEEEQCNPETIYAEVVHLAEARTGNVLQRPQLRDYEIVYLGNGSVSRDNQIPLADLMVSVQNDTIILRSKKLNKRVIPRLSTAHDFSSGSLPAYKFLGDLQFQQLHSTLMWQWSIVKDEPFLPRVRYGKIILSKCTWVLQKKDYPELIQKVGMDGVNFRELFVKIQNHLRLPQYVVMVEGDNELLINLNNESCLHILIGTLIKKERVVLKEFLSTIDQCFIKGEQGRYANEVIVPFKRIANNKHQDVNNQQISKINSKNKDLILKDGSTSLPNNIPERSFITGSEWLYVKIYCGTQSGERILKEVIKPLIENLTAENKIDKWFFIRYADPESHIRLRLHHSKDTAFWKVVLERLHAAMRDNASNTTAYKIQTDTYEREMERYGADMIESSEDVWYYDSEAVLNCIDLLEGEEGETYRWLLGARGVDMLLEDFGYDLVSKSALLKKLQQGIFSEFGGGKTLSNQLNDKYRQHMQLIRSFLDEEKDAENEIGEAVALLTIRSMKLKEVVEHIRSQAGCFDKLLPGYIHLFLNRLHLSNQRKQELILYHFLSKYYESQIAISKK